MDPISALGIAAACVQFVDFSLKAIALCKQIQANPQNATAANAELETYAAAILANQKELGAGVADADATGRRVEKAAAACAETSVAILRLLAKVRGNGSTGLSSKAKAFLRSVASRNEIQQLENQLKIRQRTLDTTLQSDFRLEAHKLAQEQTRQFELVGADNRKLLAASEENRQVQLASTRDLQSSIKQSTAATENRISVVQSSLEIVRLEGAQAVLTKALLDSLFFQDMHIRQQTIRPPYTSTFDWAFEGRSSSAAHTVYEWKVNHTLPPLSDWLQSGSTTYWVRGKAGSGKSTLMALLFHDDRTKRILESRPRETQICSFFFWRPDSSLLQKSTLGLLRSLLYQVLQKHPELALAVARERGLTAGQMPLWTAQETAKALKFALRIAINRDYLFIIDGLDEFEGPSDELLDLVFELRESTNVRFCLSSRPETRLDHRLSSCAILPLEHLNRRDIMKMVSGRLMEHPDCHVDVDKLVRLSDGVFLWASTVVQDLIQGHYAGDKPEELDLRLESIPRDVHEMYDHMLKQVDSVHLRSLSRLLRLMQIVQKDQIFRPSLALITSAFYVDEHFTVSFFLDECKLMRRRAMAQSKGLLEVEARGFNSGLLKDSLWSPFDDGSDPQSLPWPNTQQSRKTTIQSRHWHELSDLDAELLKCTTDRISWVHRSAYDFVSQMGDSVLSRAVASISEDLARESLVRGQMSMAAVSASGRLFPSDPRILSSRNQTSDTISFPIGNKIAMSLNVLDKLHQDIVWPHLDALLELMPLYHFVDLTGTNADSLFGDKDLCLSFFVSQLVEGNAIDYIHSRQDLLLGHGSRMIDVLIILHNIASSFMRITSHFLDEPSNHVMQHCLQTVQDYFPNSTYARRNDHDSPSQRLRFLPDDRSYGILLYDPMSADSKSTETWSELHIIYLIDLMARLYQVRTDESFNVLPKSGGMDLEQTQNARMFTQQVRTVVCRCLNIASVYIGLMHTESQVSNILFIDACDPVAHDQNLSREFRSEDLFGICTSFVLRSDEVWSEGKAWAPVHVLDSYACRTLSLFLNVVKVLPVQVHDTQWTRDSLQFALETAISYVGYAIRRSMAQEKGLSQDEQDLALQKAIAELSHIGSFRAKIHFTIHDPLENWSRKTTIPERHSSEVEASRYNEKIKILMDHKKASDMEEERMRSNSAGRRAFDAAKVWTESGLAGQLGQLPRLDDEGKFDIERAWSNDGVFMKLDAYVRSHSALLSRSRD